MLAVQGDGIGAEVGNNLLLRAHVFKAFANERVDQPTPRVFGIGSHPGDAAHLADFALDVHFHRVDDNLRGQVPLVEPAHDVRCLKYGHLGLLHLHVGPADAGHFRRADLKGVAQQGLKFLKIFFAKLAQFKGFCAYVLARRGFSVGGGSALRG